MICPGCGKITEATAWGSIAMHEETCPALGNGTPVYLRIGDRAGEMFVGTISVRQTTPVSTVLALFLRKFADQLDEKSW